MARKTVDVSFLIESANRQLARRDVTTEFRRGIISMLENALHAANQYHGYNYLAWCQDKNENGLTGVEQWRADGEPADNTPYLGEDTRRVYYTAPSLDRTRDFSAKGRQVLYPRGLEFRA